jgi:hypothetical protein
MLVLAVVTRLKVALGPSALRATLHQTGLRWERPQLK